MATKKKTSTRTAKVARPKAAGSAKGAARKTAKKRNPQNIAIFALLAVVVFMSIGFAAYNAQLTIGAASDATKDVTVKAASWDIHWAGKSGVSPAESGTVTELQGADLGTVTRASDTSVTFDVTLNKPGDTYQFSVSAINGGTINAELTTITMTDITSYSAYLEYTVSYAGTTYNSTTSGLSTALNAGGSAAVVVTVKYKDVANIPVASLPSSDVNLTLTASFDYEDAA